MSRKLSSRASSKNGSALSTATGAVKVHGVAAVDGDQAGAIAAIHSGCMPGTPASCRTSVKSPRGCGASGFAAGAGGLAASSGLAC